MFKILSIDVGIKNLAYCILNNSKEICDWNVLNLIEDNLFCSCDNKNGTLCKSKATFYKMNDEQTECKLGFCKKHTVPNLSPVITRKVKSISTREISELLFKTLDKYPDMLQVNTVIIENQPCLMNPMIKTIQVLLFSYFMIKGVLKDNSSITDVKAINARNKLSFYDGPEFPTFSKNKYTQRKKEGIEVCKYILNDTDQLDFFLSHKKKDDLADSFLQGIWFLSKKSK